MSKFFTILFFIISYNYAMSQEWNLVWSDEFDYSAIPNSEKWTYDTEGNNWDWGNNEAQNYTPASNNNAWVEDGNLIIEARKEQYYWAGDGETKEYTSARLITKHKGDWLYGKVEVRALLPTGTGMWPAIWMLSTDDEYGTWPKSGELDIMENVGFDPTTLHCNIHTEAYHHSIGTNKGGTIQISDPSINWHIYSMEWNAENVSFYCDDVLVFSFDNEHNTYREWPFDKRFHLLLNIAVGGGWGGLEGIDDDIFPQRMLVDYVRVYQLSEQTQQVFGGTPHAIPGIIQFEDFDIGGSGVAYYDATSTNDGGALYRENEYVDIEVCEDVGEGYNLSWTEAGEWLEYTVNVANEGEYNIVFRVACNDYGRTISLSTNGEPLVADVSIPYTGGWQEWVDVIVNNVSLSAGEQILRLTIGEVPHVNLNYMSFTKDNNSQELSINLHSGWNLIAYPLVGTINIEEALSSIWHNLEIVKEMDEYYIKSYPSELNLLQYLRYGMGYLVKVNNDCVLVWE